MFYREAGDFKTSYKDDAQTFPIRFDRYRYYVVLLVAFAVVPFLVNDYWVNAVFLPFLIYAIAAIGLNILVGYCGQVSLGTGGFMAVGAYACYKLMTGFPEINIFFHVIIAGGITAGVCVLFGLPSLRIKGFYLAVATLAAQFFLVWLFNRVPWFYNYSASGQISAPERTLFGIPITGAGTEPWATYLFCLVFTFLAAILARNLTRGTAGRKWMAIRDMDIAAEIIGVNPLRAKLSAFAISGFFVGIAGAREMAAIMTAFIMAGRVGATFAAHLATMEANEEIDALRMIGVAPFEYLVLPRLAALTLMMPLLFLYAAALGIVGGMIVGDLVLNTSPMSFLGRLEDAVAARHFVIGFVKAVCFGVLIALASCHMGMRAGRNAAEVGRAATRTVVVSIIGIIVIDAIFALCTNALGV